MLEPVINVLLVPFHERAWERSRHTARHPRGVLAAAEKASLAVLHFVIAFCVMYAATGSVAFGGLAAVLGPVCSVILMPLHDRLWHNIGLPARLA